MKTLNVRLVAILLVCGVVFGSAVFGIHYFQVRRNAYVFKNLADDAKAKAEKAEEEENLEEAREQYKEAVRNLSWYVNFVPDDLDAKAELGLLMADVANSRRMFGRAFAILEAVLREDYARTKVRRKLVEMAILMRRWSDAREHLEGYLLKESPDDAELLILLGVCRQEVREYKEAAESFKLAIEKDPTKLSAYPRLATVMRNRLSLEEEADQWMNKMVESNPDSAEAHFRLGSYLHSKGSVEEALEAARKALELEPDDRDALWLAARCALATKEYDEALAFANHGIEKHPESVPLYITKADIKLRKQSPDEALAALRAGLRATNDDPRLLWAIGNLLVEGDDIEQAGEIIARLQETRYPKSRVDYLRARIEFQQGHWLKARKLFEGIRGGLTQWPQVLKEADYRLAICHRHLLNPDEQRKILDVILKSDRFYAPALAELAQLHLAAGRLDEALNCYKQLLIQKKTPSTGVLRLARVLILKNLRLPPSQQDWRQVEQTLKLAAEAKPDAAEIPILMSEVLVAQNRLTEAEKLLTNACEKNPDVVAFRTALSALAMQAEQVEKAEELLAKIERDLGDGTELRLAKARLIIREEGEQATQQIRDLAENVEQFSENDRLNLYNGLMRFSRRLRDTEQVERLCLKIAQSSPNNLRIHFALFENALTAKDKDKMQKWLKEIERIQGKEAHWLYGEAVRLGLAAQDGDKTLYEKALHRLAEAHEKFRSWARPPAVSAGIYDELGQIEPALENYLLAFKLGDRNPMAIRRAAQLLVADGRYTEAQRVVNLLRGRRGDFSGQLDRIKDTIHWHGGEHEKALDGARKAAAGSDNPAHHVWHGHLAKARGHEFRNKAEPKKAEPLFDEAEQAYRKAIELATRKTASWVALIQLFAETGQKQKGLDTIEQAKDSIPPEDANLALGQCYESLGETAKATERFEAALAAASDDLSVRRKVANFYLRTQRPAEAGKILEGMAQGDAPPADVVWARRRLAVVTAGRGGFQNLQKAIAMIDKNLAVAPDSKQDQLLMARMLSTQQGRSQRRRAIALFENMLQNEFPLQREDRFLLIQLYLSEGPWGKAKQHFLALLAARDGNRPQYAAAYIQALLDRGELVEAELWMGRLENLAPHQFGTDNLRANLEFKRKNYDRAFELLTKFLYKPNARPAQEALRVRLVALGLENLGNQLKNAGDTRQAKRFIMEANSLLQKHVRENLRDELILAAFLARQDQTGQALNLIERSWSDSNPRAVSQTYDDLIANPKATKSQLQRAEKVLDAALRKHGRPTSLLLAGARLYAMQQRYADSERNYREILKKDPDHAVTLNNLAVLLAVQGIKLDEALKMINRAIQIAGPLPSILDSRANVYIARKETDKALADLEQAIDYNTTAIRLYHRALAYHQAGQTGDAVASLKMARDKGFQPQKMLPPERVTYEKLRKALE